MAKTTVELNLRTVFGAAFIIVGLLLLTYISIIAFQLATGAITPLKVSPQQLDLSTALFLGTILEVGMFAILLVVASILLQYGTKFILNKES
jgi:hypothetical protein